MPLTISLWELSYNDRLAWSADCSVTSAKLRDVLYIVTFCTSWFVAFMDHFCCLSCTINSLKTIVDNLAGRLGKNVVYCESWISCELSPLTLCLPEVLSLTVLRDISDNSAGVYYTCCVCVQHIHTFYYHKYTWFAASTLSEAATTVNSLHSYISRNNKGWG